MAGPAGIARCRELEVISEAVGLFVTAGALWFSSSRLVDRPTGLKLPSAESTVIIAVIETGLHAEVAHPALGFSLPSLSPHRELRQSNRTTF